jgi:hypothetical protein
MRAIWSFWTEPFVGQRRGFWANPVQPLLSWALSLETARRHYPETALYTDSRGADLLVGRLGLEFGEVSTALDALGGTDPAGGPWGSSGRTGSRPGRSSTSTTTSTCGSRCRSR